MTRSPLFSLSIPLLPLVLLGIPLWVVTRPSSPPQNPRSEEKQNREFIAADLSVVSAHPFLTLSVEIDGQSWTFENDEIQEVQLPRSEDFSATLLVRASWPEGTPLTALLLELTPEGLEDRSKTLWGETDIIEEIQFQWQPTQ